MGFYDKYILPHFLNCACGSKPILYQREKVVPMAEGLVLEVGIGSGLNIPYYQKDNIKEIWDILESDVLDYVFNIMKSQAFIDHTKEVNTNYAFIPIIVYAYNKGSEKLSQEEVKKIVKWFYYSQIRFRYISQLQQKLDKDLGIIEKTENPFPRFM